MRSVILPAATLAAVFVLAQTAISTAQTTGETPTRATIPVILDTDIGDDIDDTWALALLLKSSEVDLKLVVSDRGHTVYRAKLIAKLLQIAGRTDIPVGVGLSEGDKEGPQGPWVADYDLARYPGKVHQDGVGALIDTIMASSQPITLICIGPMPNIRAALDRQPEIAKRARFVGMYGSVRKGYDGSAEPHKEWNVVADAKAAQRAFTAEWPMLITPLDTCGIVRLRGDKYRRVAECQDPVTKAVIENYRIWSKAGDKPLDASSVLFDTVAIYLAFSTDLVNVERLSIRVTDDGFTRIDPQGKPMDCAMSWKDLGAFEDLLVARLTGGR